VSDLVSGRFRVGVVSKLPVKGVTLLLGNDIAGGNFIPVLEVADNPESTPADDKLVQKFPHVFPACVLTSAQSRKLGDVVYLSGSIFESIEQDHTNPSSQSTEPTVSTPIEGRAPQLHKTLLSVTPEKVIECQ